jgi:hypothetical protein
MPAGEYASIMPSQSPAPVRSPVPARRRSSVAADDHADEYLSLEVATAGETGVDNQAGEDHKPTTRYSKLVKLRSHSFSASGSNTVVMTKEEREWMKKEKMRAFEDLLEAKAEITIKFSLTPTLVY